MILKYLKFLTKASNQHGVHSPFVYQLITKCVYKKSEKKTQQELDEIRNDLKNNETFIKVTDFGSGSRVFKNNTRKVKDILKNAAVKKKHGMLLNRLTSYLEIESVLELGTSLGVATHAFVLNNNKVFVNTIEGCPETLAIANNLFKRKGVDKQIQTHVGQFEHVLEKLLINQQYDLIYFDGNHQKEATLNYFETCLKNKHNNSVFIFDDIYWSDGMEDAWNLIKKHPEVRVTVDLFQWGIVFFRKEQEKEHFKIRF